MNNFKKLLSIILILSSTNSIADEFTGYADIVEPLIPAVVNISVKVKKNEPTDDAPLGNQKFPEGSPFQEFNELFERFGLIPNLENDGEVEKPAAAGSGFIIDQTGYIVTNSHVIDKADKIQVIMNNEEKYEAKLIGSDPRTDLAVLKIEAKKNLPFVKFGDSDKSRVGDIIIAIGNPFALGGTVTTGIISAHARDINAGTIVDNFIQTDAAINKGNSGGPMFNIKGEVIGINTAIYSPSGGNVGIGFAVPSSIAEVIIKQLKETGKVKRAWLGVRIQMTDELSEGLGIEEGKGALVSEVTKGSPADKAGIIVGDVILKVNGIEINNHRKLPRVISEIPVGEDVILDVLSKGKEKKVKSKLAELDLSLDNKDQKGEPNTKLGELKKDYGIMVADLTPALKTKLMLPDSLKGALITSIDRNGLAFKRGLRKGDIISAINQVEVNTGKELQDLLNNAKSSGKKRVMMQVNRGSSVIFVSFSVN